MDIIDEDEVKRYIANNVKFFRKQTQEKLSEETNIPLDTISTIERGIYMINAFNLIKISKALGVTPNDILMKYVTKKDEDYIDKQIKEELMFMSNDDKKFFLSIIRLIKNKNDN